MFEDNLSYNRPRGRETTKPRDTQYVPWLNRFTKYDYVNKIYSMFFKRATGGYTESMY